MAAQMTGVKKGALTEGAILKVSPISALLAHLLVYFFARFMRPGPIYHKQDRAYR